ncbi:MAG: geranylgeranylglyceryl/heptaprenylglyceryl phosphate synthase [Bacteroidales bacterium]|nr:geranylgeranylglyceryl/heptaprenylglyceryl phosphate synthase [Bacteroidales bacterium]
MIYNQIFESGRKIFIVLIDPEFHTVDSVRKTADTATIAGTDLILVGGSLTSRPVDNLIEAIKDSTDCPVLLFPGNLFQLSDKADGILLSSMISGRNPEYLIGNHVLISQFLKKSGLEIIPTGYLLIDGHPLSSVEYISNTRPIPADKTDIIAATALAGEQLGLKLIYLEAGSGAARPVKEHAITAIKNIVTLPLIAGGGIKTPADIRLLYKSGANGVVVGSAVENDLRILKSLARVKLEF